MVKLNTVENLILIGIAVVPLFATNKFFRTFRDERLDPKRRVFSNVLVYFWFIFVILMFPLSPIVALLPATLVAGFYALLQLAFTVYCIKCGTPRSHLPWLTQGRECRSCGAASDFLWRLPT